MKTLKKQLLSFAILAIMITLATTAYSRPPPGGAGAEPGSKCASPGVGNVYQYTGNAWRGMVTLTRPAGAGDQPVSFDADFTKDQDCNCQGTVSAIYSVANQAEWDATTPDNLRGACLIDYVTSFSPAPCRNSDYFELVGVGTVTTSTDGTTKTFEGLIRELAIVTGP